MTLEYEVSDSNSAKGIYFNHEAYQLPMCLWVSLHRNISAWCHRGRSRGRTLARVTKTMQSMTEATISRGLISRAPCVRNNGTVVCWRTCKSEKFRRNRVGDKNVNFADAANLARQKFHEFGRPVNLSTYHDQAFLCLLHFDKST